MLLFVQGKMFSFHGSWIPGHSSGGCSDDLASYSTNPQFGFTISGEDFVILQASGHGRVNATIVRWSVKAQLHVQMCILASWGFRFVTSFVVSQKQHIPDRSGDWALVREFLFKKCFSSLYSWHPPRQISRLFDGFRERRLLSDRFIDAKVPEIGEETRQ